MADLLEAQRRLQDEADEIVRSMQLVELLDAIGTPIRVGSSAMGLMVRRDIDITVVCPKLDGGKLEAFANVAAQLMQRATLVVSARFRNDTGIWNAEPAKYPDGLYLGLTVHARDGAVWTLDIWAVDDPTRQPDLAHLKTLLPRITEAHRKTILEIKQVLADRPKTPESIPSALVYEAVVDHDIQTVEQLELWWREQPS